MAYHPGGPSIQGRLLEVTVVGCEHLGSREMYRIRDAYVVIEYSGQKFRTRTVTNGGKHPSFNETFKFPLIEGLQGMNASVWDSNRIERDDYIGITKISLSKVIETGYDDTQWSLINSRTGVSSGVLRLILHYAYAKSPKTPAKVKAFINSVVNTPLDNIDAPLSKFSWDYEMSDFFLWMDLLNHFELFFEQYVKSRKDLHLEGEFLEGDGQFPKEAVLQVLRVIRIILKNCMNDNLYNQGVRRLWGWLKPISLLLASTDPDIVIASLRTLPGIMKKPIWHVDATLNDRLFSLSQGWGGKEEGLGLLACAMDNGCDANACKLGTTLHFEFNESDLSSSHGETNPSGLRVIHIPDLHLRLEEDLQLLKLLIDQYQVPSNLRFSLLTRIRFARAFANLKSRRQYICIWLLAFTVLLQAYPNHMIMRPSFINGRECVDELVTVLRYEDTVPEEIRLLSILALAAQLQTWSGLSNVLDVIRAGDHRDILPSLMQKAISSIIEGTSGCSVAFVEGLLSLVTVLVSSPYGCVALREAGLIPTLLPLLKDTDPQHTHLVSAAAHILEAFDYNNRAATMSRYLEAPSDTLTRLNVNVLEDSAFMEDNNAASSLSRDLEGVAADGGEEQMENDDGFDRDPADEACIDEVEEEHMREVADDATELEEVVAVINYGMEHGPDDEIVDEEDIDGDEGEDDGEEEDEDDMNGDEGGNIVEESGVDEATDELQIPIGISAYLYAEETRILNGGSLLEDSDPILFAAHLYGKGSVPSATTTELEQVETKTLVKHGCGIHEDIPSHVYSTRLQLQKKKMNLDLQKKLKDLTSQGRRFLYHGLRSWGYVPSMLIDGMGGIISNKNEFGNGFYLTDDLDYAQTCAGIRGGAILIFDWTDEKGLSKKVLIDDEWENTVKGWICLHIPNTTKPGPPRHREDMLIGKISSNYDKIMSCKRPMPSEIQQFVAKTERAYCALNKSLVAIIYLE